MMTSSWHEPNILMQSHSWSLVVTRGHSWSLVVTRALLVVTRGHSWSFVVTLGHSCSLVCTFRHDLRIAPRTLSISRHNRQRFIGQKWHVTIQNRWVWQVNIRKKIVTLQGWTKMVVSVYAGSTRVISGMLLHWQNMVYWIEINQLLAAMHSINHFNACAI